jgi:phosphatidylserine/phosphatidylglycerophosphate/cardiolipin synthase-like enzyme
MLFAQARMSFVFKVLKKIVILGVFLSLIVAVFSMYKSLPKGVHTEGPIRAVPVDAVRFLYDVTYLDPSGIRHTNQQIFDQVFSMIAGAKHMILLDMFLYNSYQGVPPEKNRALSEELTTKLLEKKKEIPSIDIVVLTDPINETYGGDVSSQFDRLRAAGIVVGTTDLTRLRDSNPLYSGFWRTFVQWFGNSNTGGMLPHPFQSGGNKVTIRSYLILLNFKANHRKLIVADETRAGVVTLSTLIMSANPHDGSSAHGNIAVKVSESLYQDAIVSEQSVAAFSRVELPTLSTAYAATPRVGGDAHVELLTEGAIKEHLVTALRKLTSGDSVDMAMFYLSERTIVKELIAAAKRGIKIRIVLDPNKDAFGHKKNGVPNRPVAEEILAASGGNAEIRWCDTHGEQCHAKMTLIQSTVGYEMIAGSANLTRRNIGDYNLETNVSVTSTEKIQAIADAYRYFEMIWSNKDGNIYTTDYTTYKDTALYKKIMYRVMEFTGLSSF